MTIESLASIAVGRPVHGEFTYVVPDELAGKLSPGQRVLIPFGRGRALGFYLGAAAAASSLLKLKPISRLLDAGPVLPGDLITLLRFAAQHYRYPLGEAIRTALPPGLSSAGEAPPLRPDFQVFAILLKAFDDADASLKRAPSQAAVVSYLAAVGGRATVDEIAHAIPGARDSVRRLEEKAWLRLEKVEIGPHLKPELGQSRPTELTPAQSSAVKILQTAIDQRRYRSFLLHGVTGSGKTEVYMRAMEHAQAAGLGGLVLVPEIALTPQLVGRFRSRFGSNVAVLHSSLKDRERLNAWKRLRSGEIKIAVGVRSAVFAPIEQLGLIVVDEEHDGSFKQEDKFRYHARDLAVVRARNSNSVIVLGSATPSLETLENARRGRYERLSLNTRVDERPLPPVSLVDLRVERPRFSNGSAEEGPILAPTVRTAMEEVLARGQQTILFLNRRGHSTFLLCEVCGGSLKCPSCDVSLTHHLSIGKVLCHYCGYASAIPEGCPECGSALLKLGTGTERVEAEVAGLFPQARVARLDRDAATSAERVTDLLAAFARREIDVLVGTQMVAKGHDFPGVTLVCVVLADTALSIPDFRASERTFQLLTQVAGRAGRGKDPGRVLIQTYNPDSEPIRRSLTHDFEGFACRELEWRRALAYPPFSRMVAFRIDGPDPEQTASVSRAIGKKLAGRLPPASRGVRLLGPAPAPLARIKNRWRWQLLLKGPTHATLFPLCQDVEGMLDQLPRAVRVVIDVDPGTML